MKRYLLDTGAASDLINRRNLTHKRADEANERGDRLGLCTPVLGELIFGFELSESPKRSRRLLAAAWDTLHLWPFDEEAANEYGRLAAVLRRMGRSMQQIDIQIAAVAFTLGRCTVVTMDSDLSAIPGLIVEDWSK